MNQELKETLRLFLSMTDTLDLSSKVMEKINSDMKWSEMIKIELLQFLMYLAASDGEITRDESTFILDYLDIDFSPYKINKYVKENDIYSVDFEEEPPASLKLMVLADNSLHEQELDLGQTISEAMIELYRRMGKEFIQCDGIETEQEKEDLNIFIRSMRDFAFDNLDIHKTSVKTGYDKKPRKTPKDTPIIENCDVAAPKKEG